MIHPATIQKPESVPCFKGQCVIILNRHFKGMGRTVVVGITHRVMANNSVHAGAKGFLYKLGTYNQEEVLLQDPLF